MNTKNKNEGRPSGQSAAGSASKQLRALHAKRVEEIKKRLVELKRHDQPWRSIPAKVSIPCEFHVFLPRAGTVVGPSAGTLRTLIWSPHADRPLGRESFVIPQWENGECFQLLNVEGKKTLLLTGEVKGTKIEVPDEPLDWMPDPTAELQVVFGSGFMTFDPRDFFMGHVDHAYGGMRLEPHLPVDWFTCEFGANLSGDLTGWWRGLIAYSMQAGPKKGGDRGNLEALARAGLVWKFHMGLCTVFSAQSFHTGRRGDRAKRPRLVAVFPGQQ